MNSSDQEDQKDQLLVKLFDQLACYWRDEQTPEEIGDDIDKINLMNEFSTVLSGTKTEIPSSIRRLYLKVYLRDVWGT